MPKKTHGYSTKNNSTYVAWMNMRQRVMNSNRPDYHHYGGRGISICDEWEVFSAFLADMGEKPDGTSLDRIDNEGNYNPGNCHWATWEEQANNQRIRKDNKSGFKGVFWNDQRKKWEVYVKGKRIGAYESKDEAIKVRSDIQDTALGVINLIVREE